MALGRLVYLASFGILFLIKDCGGFYYYNHYRIGIGIGDIGMGVIIFFWIFCMVCCCCFCCRCKRNVDENVDTGEMNANLENQQRIVTSTASAGVHYQPKPYSSSSNEVLSPFQLYSYSGLYNFPFEKGIESRDHSLGVASPPPYEEPAPSYESVVRRGTCPSYTTKGNT